MCYSSEECRATAFLCDRVSAPDAAGSGLFLLPFCGEAGKVKELVTRISYIYLRKGNYFARRKEGWVFERLSLISYRIAYDQRHFEWSRGS